MLSVYDTSDYSQGNLRLGATPSPMDEEKCVKSLLLKGQPIEVTGAPLTNPSTATSPGDTYGPQHPVCTRSTEQLLSAHPACLPTYLP